ncbi:hypothetical protein [Mesorhizobium australicum]|uniref:hypothetical protein n=1 Tax=Mesorhizobium australicum TaxID=536018 RepID=UPI00333D73E5
MAWLVRQMTLGGAMAREARFARGPCRTDVDADASGRPRAPPCSDGGPPWPGSRPVEAFVDHDPLLVKEDRAENIGIEADARTRHAEQPVRVVELNADLQVLLDDVVDRDRRFDRDAARMGIFSKKRLRVFFNCLVGDIGYELGH